MVAGRIHTCLFVHCSFVSFLLSPLLSSLLTFCYLHVILKCNRQPFNYNAYKYEHYCGVHDCTPLFIWQVSDS